MQMKLFAILISLSFAAKQNKFVAEIDENYGGNVNKIIAETIFVKIEEDEYAKTNKRGSSQHIGVSYEEKSGKWYARRRSKHEKKMICNGNYENEKTAAHASDTLARKLMQNGEQGHKLNFPYDDNEVLAGKASSSQFIGVSYHVNTSKWQTQRYSKHEKKKVCNGSYETKETAAHASDTLARTLMANGEQGHKLNFPDDDISVFPEKCSSQFFGVSYDVKKSKWQTQRYSKREKKIIFNGGYENEETAAHASDTLARKLLTNGEKGHKLNFPEDYTEVFPERQRKRKRPVKDNPNHHKND
jgi:hypothetical protein